MCNGFIRVLYSYNYPDNKLIKNSVSIFLLSVALKMKVSCKYCVGVLFFHFDAKSMDICDSQISVIRCPSRPQALQALQALQTPPRVDSCPLAPMAETSNLLQHQHPSQRHFLASCFPSWSFHAQPLGRFVVKEASCPSSMLCLLAMAIRLLTTIELAFSSAVLHGQDQGS